METHDEINSVQPLLVMTASITLLHGETTAAFNTIVTKLHDLDFSIRISYLTAHRQSESAFQHLNTTKPHAAAVSSLHA